MEAVDKVPPDLEKLVKYIMRGFYGVEYRIFMEMLIKNPCVNEADLCDVLKFEKKQLRQVALELKKDQFIKVKKQVQSLPDNKTIIHDYYHINYKMLVNVVKYKLHMMQKKIELETRDKTSRASFKCPTCERTYTDLDIGKLMNLSTGEFNCIFCSDIVEEDMSTSAEQDANTLMRFNEQMAELYKLLKAVEDIKLGVNILEPEPTDMTKVLSKQPGHQKKEDLGGHDVWSGEKHKGYHLYSEQASVSVNLESDMHESGSQLGGSTSRNNQPVWLSESSVPGAAILNKSPIHSATPNTKAKRTKTDGKTSSSDDIVQTLLIHERKSTTLAAAAGVSGHEESDGSDPSDSEDGAGYPPSKKLVTTTAFRDSSPAATRGASAESKTGNKYVESEEVMVRVAGSLVPLNNIDNSFVAKMSANEKQEYISISRLVHSTFYD